MIFEEKRVNSKMIYDGRILNLKLDTVTTKSGHAHREVVEHNGAAAAVAVTDDNRIVMIRQYRYPAGRVVLEVPAGKIDPGEDDPEKTMIRELKEETGYTAGEIAYLGRIMPSVGYSEEIIYLYLMKDIVGGEQELDEDEDIEIVLMPFEEAYSMARKGELEDAKSIAAIFMAAEELL